MRLVWPLLLVGCTSTAGPFVTDIRPVAPGRLAVERCSVVYSKASGTIASDEDSCSTSIIDVFPQPQPMMVPPPPPAVVPQPPPGGVAPPPQPPPQPPPPPPSPPRPGP